VKGVAVRPKLAFLPCLLSRRYWLSLIPRQQRRNECWIGTESCLFPITSTISRGKDPALHTCRRLTSFNKTSAEAKKPWRALSICRKEAEVRSRDGECSPISPLNKKKIKKIRKQIVALVPPALAGQRERAALISGVGVNYRNSQEGKRHLAARAVRPKGGWGRGESPPCGSRKCGTTGPGDPGWTSPGQMRCSSCSSVYRNGIPPGNLSRAAG